jgi:hypothetical protein
LRPCACYTGRVFVGYVDDYGVEREAEEEWDSAEPKAEMLETLEEICVEAHELFESYEREVGVSDGTL